MSFIETFMVFAYERIRGYGQGGSFEGYWGIIIEAKDFQ